MCKVWIFWFKWLLLNVLFFVDFVNDFGGDLVCLIGDLVFVCVDVDDYIVGYVYCVLVFLVFSVFLGVYYCDCWWVVFDVGKCLLVGFGFICDGDCFVCVVFLFVG